MSKRVGQRAAPRARARSLPSDAIRGAWQAPTPLPVDSGIPRRGTIEHSGVSRVCTGNHPHPSPSRRRADSGRARHHDGLVVWDGVVHGVHGTPKQGVAGSIPAGGITFSGRYPCDGRAARSAVDTVVDDQRAMVAGKLERHGRTSLSPNCPQPPGHSGSLGSTRPACVARDFATLVTRCGLVCGDGND
jgi:hypothetical protein